MTEAVRRGERELRWCGSGGMMDMEGMMNRRGAIKKGQGWV